MSNYYNDKLSAERLVRVYDIAPPRIRKYLDAEIEHVVKKIRQSDIVLELGCGYGHSYFFLEEFYLPAARVLTLTQQNSAGKK